MMPLPWIACEMAGFVAEFGRQPWTDCGDFTDIFKYDHLG